MRTACWRRIRRRVRLFVRYRRLVLSPIEQNTFHQTLMFFMSVQKVLFVRDRVRTLDPPNEICRAYPSPTHAKNIPCTHDLAPKAYENQKKKSLDVGQIRTDAPKGI